MEKLKYFFPYVSESTNSVKFYLENRCQFAIFLNIFTSHGGLPEKYPSALFDTFGPYVWNLLLWIVSVAGANTELSSVCLRGVFTCRLEDDLYLFVQVTWEQHCDPAETVELQCETVDAVDTDSDVDTE